MLFRPDGSSGDTIDTLGSTDEKRDTHKGMDGYSVSNDGVGCRGAIASQEQSPQSGLGAGSEKELRKGLVSRIQRYDDRHERTKKFREVRVISDKWTDACDKEA